MKLYKCIIYDFDGVICDSVNLKTEAFISMYERYGKGITDKVKSYHLKHGGISRFEKFKYYEEIILNHTISDKKLKELGEIFSEIVLNSVINTPLNPGVIEFLNSNINTKIQFICSGTPNEEINYIIKKKNLNKYFHGIFGSPDSKTLIINNILSKYNLISSEVLFIGDAMTDFNAAKETEIDFIGVENLDTTFPIGTKTIKNFKELL